MHIQQPEEISCPNCGYAASGNYCAACGQKNYLPRETFWQLIGNFFGHLVDYESKAWQTLKTLWLKPGELTIAFWQNKRARFVAPVSLYFFISSVFFVVFYLSPARLKNTLEIQFSNTSVQEMSEKEKAGLLAKLKAQSSKSITDYMEYKQAKMAVEHPDISTYLQQKYAESFPKIFFFMIPVMAFILKLLFVRRRNLFFVEHTIFSLHFHSFGFTILLFYYLNVFQQVSDILFSILLLIACGYMIMALRNAYQLSWPRSVLYTAVLFIGYVCIQSVLALFNLGFIIATS